MQETPVQAALSFPLCRGGLREDSQRYPTHPAIAVTALSHSHLHSNLLRWGNQGAKWGKAVSKGPGSILVLRASFEVWATLPITQAGTSVGSSEGLGWWNGGALISHAWAWWGVDVPPGAGMRISDKLIALVMSFSGVGHLVKSKLLSSPSSSPHPHSWSSPPATGNPKREAHGAAVTLTALTMWPLAHWDFPRSGPHM